MQIETLNLLDTDNNIFSKYPMLRLLRDIIVKYPDVTVTPCNHWYKTKEGLDVLSGYHVNFGTYTLSVQFGFGNYRTGYSSEKLEKRNLTQDHYLKNTIDAEIAVIDNSQTHNPLVFIPAWHDEVLGYQTTEQIMNFIDTWIVPKLGSGG